MFFKIPHSIGIVSKVRHLYIYNNQHHVATLAIHLLGVHMPLSEHGSLKVAKWLIPSQRYFFKMLFQQLQSHRSLHNHSFEFVPHGGQGLACFRVQGALPVDKTVP